jgi:hypothetical protein
MSLRKAATPKGSTRSAAKARAKAAMTKPSQAKLAAAKPAGGRSAVIKIIPAKANESKPTDGDPVVSAEATELAARIERDLRDGRLDTLSPQAFQTLMAALCRSYGARLEAGADFLPVADRNSVSPTEIMTATSGLLRAANLAVFELGMWQSWTGR